MSAEDFSSYTSRILTAGDYPDEETACAALDRAIYDAGIFQSHSQVAGTYAYRPHFKKHSDPKIDRILIPKKNLIDAGWQCGIVGIEVKRSNKELGPAISQMLDYMTADWTLPDKGGITVRLGYCFLFPLDRIGFDTASIFNQNRLGQALIKYHPQNEKFRLQFFSGEQSLLYYYFNHDEAERLCVNGKPAGSKRGSR